MAEESLLPEEKKQNIEKILSLEITGDEDYLKFLEFTDPEFEEEKEEKFVYFPKNVGKNVGFIIYH